jgi:hypothetical protein
MNVRGSALASAAGHASVPNLEMLIAAGAEPLDPNVACMAAVSRKVEPAEFDPGADPTGIGPLCRVTLLQWSAWSNDSTAITAVLLARGADVNLGGAHGTRSVRLSKHTWRQKN